MVSVIRAPENRYPNCSAMMVTTGIMALRSACPSTTRARPAPLARAVRM